MKNVFTFFICFILLSDIIFSQDQFTEQTLINLTGVSQSSVAWGDYDNDGDLDIILTGLTAGSTLISKIYKNNGDNTFTEQTSISLIGVYLGSVDWGDYDNDGDLDILLSGYNDSQYFTKIYKNNGDNSFTEQTSISLIGVSNGSVVWVDYDNDGYLDIFLTGTYNDVYCTTKIYHNNRDNSFTEQTSISLPALYEASVSWGDYDNDGDLDILLSGSSESGGITRVYRNNGDNTFTEQSSIYLDDLAWGSVDWGDYDNDGDLDILLSGVNSNAVTKVYRNNGDNTFSEQTSILLTGVYYSSIKWGDYDNDGDLDILLTGTDGNLLHRFSKIYHNNGDNTFSEQTSILLTGVYESSVAWGDYDNDGDLDFILTGFDGSNFITKIYRNNNVSANTVPTVPTNLSTIVNGRDVTFHWNKSTDSQTPQNGLKYNLVIGTSPNAVNTLSPMSDRTTGFRRVINLGNTNQNNSWTIKGLADGLYYWSVQAIDNTFAGSAFSPEKRFAIPELFTEQTSVSLTNVYSSSVAWGDYDNDGDLDILMNGDTGGYTSFTKLYQNNSGSFTPVSTNLFNTDFGSVDWGDYDNDGDLDVLMTGFNSGNRTYVYRNDGGGTFTNISAGLTPLTYSSAAWGDYDNDGDLDILEAGGGVGEIPTTKLYRNDSGTFTEVSAGFVPAEWGSVAWGDYDNDGDMDIVISGAATWGCCPQTNIYRNNGDGTFTNINAGLTGVYYSSVKWGDYDNDGDLDILIAGYNGSSDVAKIYRNDNGLFTDIAAELTGVRSCSVAWGDYDNDGDLDILLTGYNESVNNISEVYRNNGDNTFTKQSSIVLEGVSSSSVAWGDYDNDGDLDILLTGNNGLGGVSKIYRNNLISPNNIPNAPTNLSSAVNAGLVTLSWNKSTDTETPQNGLKYNIVVGSNPGAIDKLSPMSDRGTGFRKVVKQGNTNHNNSWTIKGLSIGKYYWSVQAIDNNFAGSVFAGEQSFQVTHFTKNWINPYQPMNIYITEAKIDGVDLKAGDEIAIFDGNNCVGVIALNSSIPSGGYVTTILSADDPTTTEIDGFTPGNTITYRFWDAERSSEINRMTPTYSEGDGTFSLLGTAVVDLNGVYTITHNIDLSSGWNIFSLRVIPTNQNMMDLLNPLISSNFLIKVQDEGGNAVDKLPPPIGWINSIGNWLATEGYFIKVNTNTALSVTDPPILLPFTIPLKTGWNIISYPVLTEQNALDIFQTLINASQLIKVQDEAGNAVVYLPGIGWKNDIGNLKSGEGYYLKTNTNTNLVFENPSPGFFKDNENIIRAPISKINANHFVPVYSGNPFQAMNIYVNQADLIGGSSLVAGDEIGIFDGNYCVGAAVLNGPINSSNLLAMKASTDDPTTVGVIDGFTSGHSISYKFWLTSSSLEVSDYSASYDLGNGTFESGGTALVGFTNVLSVELYAFNAEVIGNEVRLNWNTSTEVNNYGFEIERSIYGDNWSKIGFVQGNGNSNSPKSYSFVDKNPIGSTLFNYRLKQIDQNGISEYSNIIEVKFLPTKFDLYQNYPNPFNPITSIRYQLPTENKVVIKIFNILGAEVMDLLNERKEAGIYEIKFNAESLPSGTYIYKIIAGDFIQTKKMILLK